jgi:hypothetical protein
LFDTDLLHVQQYLFNKLKIEPTTKIKVEYDGSKLLHAVKVDDENDVNPPPFSILYFDLHTYSGIQVVKVVKTLQGMRVIALKLPLSIKYTILSGNITCHL